MEEIYEAFFTYLEKVGEYLDRLSELAKAKNIAAQRGDVLSVNECMREEQEIGLTLRRMDKQRQRLLTVLHLDGVPLSAVPAHCPPELRPAARAAVETLLTKRDIYRSAADAARATLECSLHNVEKLIEQKEPTGRTGPRARGGLFTDYRT
ncbi:MAG: hypothetical protein IJR72_00080 [Oscillospiraceae bacterium]|nr:hypothetical protein [Oscillospiraceae bacterium]